MGQLGDGTTTLYSTVPVQVTGIGGSGTLDGVSQIATDRQGFCALLTSNGVDCWGVNDNGELGDGTTTDSSVPVAVVGESGSGTLSGVASVVSGGLSDYCAVLISGGMDCWGFNDDELGDGTTTDSSTPVLVLGVGGGGILSGVVAAAAYGSGYCAVLGSGGVDCWGVDLDGENGVGTFEDDSGVPVEVVGVGKNGTLSGVASVVSSDGGSSTAGDTNCAVLGSGGVDCWGDGEEGMLGNGIVADSAVPVEVVS